MKIKEYLEVAAGIGLAAARWAVGYPHPEPPVFGTPPSNQQRLDKALTCIDLPAPSKSKAASCVEGFNSLKRADGPGPTIRDFASATIDKMCAANARGKLANALRDPPSDADRIASYTALGQISEGCKSENIAPWEALAAGAGDGNRTTFATPDSLPWPRRWTNGRRLIL